MKPRSWEGSAPSGGSRGESIHCPFWLVKAAGVLGCGYSPRLWLCVHTVFSSCVNLPVPSCFKDMSSDIWGPTDWCRIVSPFRGLFPFAFAKSLCYKRRQHSQLTQGLGDGFLLRGYYSEQSRHSVTNCSRALPQRTPAQLTGGAGRSLSHWPTG